MEDKSRPLCPMCNRPMAKSGRAKLGAYIRQQFKCAHIDCKYHKIKLGRRLE